MDQAIRLAIDRRRAAARHVGAAAVAGKAAIAIFERDKQLGIIEYWRLLDHLFPRYDEHPAIDVMQRGAADLALSLGPVVAVMAVAIGIRSAPQPEPAQLADHGVARFGMHGNRDHRAGLAIEPSGF